MQPAGHPSVTWRCTPCCFVTPGSGAGMLLLEAEQWSETERLLHATVRDKRNDPYGWMALGVMNLRRWQLEPKVQALKAESVFAAVAVAHEPESSL